MARIWSIMVKFFVQLEECVLCSCWGECFINLSLFKLVDGVQIFYILCDFLFTSVSH